jgi:hypothetical protein
MFYRITVVFCIQARFSVGKVRPMWKWTTLQQKASYWGVVNTFWRSIPNNVSVTYSLKFLIEIVLWTDRRARISVLCRRKCTLSGLTTGATILLLKRCIRSHNFCLYSYPFMQLLNSWLYKVAHSDYTVVPLKSALCHWLPPSVKIDLLRHYH